VGAPAIVIYVYLLSDPLRLLTLVSMELPRIVATYVCGCRRSFSGPGPLNFHKHTCKSSKRVLQEALTKARDLWDRRKRPHVDSRLPDSSENFQLESRCEADMEGVLVPEIVCVFNRWMISRRP
jgi:hypothetical protein